MYIILDTKMGQKTKMVKSLNEITNKLKMGPVDPTLSQKPFADGMYRFVMLIIEYYSRVKKQLNIDYDSFIIVQTVVSHNLYNLKKKGREGLNYTDLESEWEKLLETTIIEKKNAPDLEGMGRFTEEKSKLTMSSICLVTELPKETVRRKVGKLIKLKILKNSKNKGITLGSRYADIFKEFVPESVRQVARMLQEWEKLGIIKNVLNIKV